MIGVYDAHAAGKRGHVKLHPPVKSEHGAGSKASASQANGMGLAPGFERHRHVSAPNAMGSHQAASNGGGGTPTNHWALVWDLGAKAGAAAVAASSSSARGRLGQWARLRREARGGGVLPSGEIEALGRQYNCLEHEFEGFKQKWPALEAEAASRRALRRAQSAHPLPSHSRAAATAANPHGAAGQAALSHRHPSRPRTAPSSQLTPGQNVSGCCSSIPHPGRQGTRTPERHAAARTPSRPRWVSGGRTPERTPPPSHHRAKQAHTRHARTPERLPLPRLHSQQTPPLSSIMPTPERQRTLCNNSSRLPGPASSAAERAQRCPQPLVQPLTLLTPLRTGQQQQQQQVAPATQPSPQKLQFASKQGKGVGPDVLHTGLQQQQQQQHTSSDAAASTNMWRPEGSSGARTYSPFCQPMGLEGADNDDDEDPFSLPVLVGPPAARSRAGKLATTAAAEAPPPHTSATPSRHLRQSTDLLLPSLGSVNAMLAATSNPATPRTAQKSAPSNLPHLPRGSRTSATSSCVRADPDGHKQLEQEQMAHAQHIRLMQRRLVQEQRRLDALQAAAAAGSQGAAGTTAGPSSAERMESAGAPPAGPRSPASFILAPPAAPMGSSPRAAHEHVQPRLATAALHGDGAAASASSSLSSSTLQGEGVTAAATTLQRKQAASRIPTWALPSGSSAASPMHVPDSEKDGAGGSANMRVMAMAAALAEANRQAHGPSLAASPPVQQQQQQQATRDAQKAGTRTARGVVTAAASPGAQRAVPAAAAAGAMEQQGPQTRAGGASKPRGGRAAQRPRVQVTPPSGGGSSGKHSAALSPSTPKSAPRVTAATRTKAGRGPHPASTFSAAASAAMANPGHSSCKPPYLGPLHTKTSVGHFLVAKGTPSTPTSRRPASASSSDPAAAALAAAASLSTARSRSGLSSAAACRALSAVGSAASSTQHSPRPSCSGAQSPTQTPLPPRGCAHAHRPSSTSATPAFVTPCDPAPGSTHSTPPFHTPPSRPDSNGRAGSDRRSSSGVPGGHSYLLRLQREARARHAAAAAEVGSPTLATGGNTAAAPACGPSLIRSPCSPSVSMRSADAGSPPDAPITLLHPHRPLSHNPGTPREDLGASCSSSGSSSGRCSWQQQAARQIAAPLMRSVPTHIAFSPSTCASSADRGSPMQCERAEDMLPLKQLSVLRQSRMSCASSASSATAVSHATPASQFHTPPLKGRSSDGSVPYRGQPSSSQQHTPSNCPTPPHNGRPPFRLSTSNPLKHSLARLKLPSPSPPHASLQASGNLGARARGTPPPACTPLPFQALQSKSFTAGSGVKHPGGPLAAARAAAALQGAAREAAAPAAAAAQGGCQPGRQGSRGLLQVLPSQRQQPQPHRHHPSFEATTQEELDADADVELVSRSSSYQSHCGSFHRGNSSELLTGTVSCDAACNGAPAPVLATRGANNAKAQTAAATPMPADLHEQQQQQPHLAARVAASPVKAVASYWSRLFSRPSGHHQAAAAVGEMG